MSRVTFLVLEYVSLSGAVTGRGCLNMISKYHRPRKVIGEGCLNMIRMPGTQTIGLGQKVFT